MSGLWRNRDFTALWTGQVVATLGATITATAMPLLVLATTGSARDAGLVGAAGTLPYLLVNLPAGALVDRLRRHRILLIGQLVAALTMVTVPVAIRFGWLSVAQLCAVMFVQGVCFVFVSLAERAALPRVVPPGQLATAIAHNEARQRGAGLAGRPLGGVLFAAGHALPFLLDAVSYLVAAVALLFVRRDLDSGTPPAERSLWRSAAEGLRWVWRHPLVRAAILLVAASNLVFQALVLVLVVLAQRHGASASEIGVMLGVYSGGGLLGAVAAGRLHRHFSPRMVIVGVNWVWVALLPLFLVAGQPWLLGLIGAATSFVGPLWNVVLGTYMTTLVPNELLGRVGSAGMTLSWGVLPLGSLLAGFLLDGIGPAGVVGVLAGIMLVTAVAATVSPAVRAAPPLAGSPAPDRVRG
ncbi:MFS family permease [Actinoplanes octamycinicus]|uniref:MFS family permease n=1 Tax=Actinoplanes octamycinicus TaxID=135948 RepID=A0A7W7H596_9ACTN|nr:MFS transporter [Actinoplanes octamycinicus]MBB4744265.1 MFS family permease [Actinoplanes octamycinicus]GIE56777.1 MFS transporter [Actinoplanes octamycinicus]